jgi:murein DD-endopeptidase MepM/ murein hydrolase activator NlpD
MEMMNSNKNHLGLDIAAAYDSRIKATGPGIVTFSGWKDDFGNLVEIDHGYGFVTRYGHCSRIIVNKGDLVERSQTIAYVGSSGRSSAPHVHFELLKDGKHTDPLIFIYK